MFLTMSIWLRILFGIAWTVFIDLVPTLLLPVAGDGNSDKIREKFFANSKYKDLPLSEQLKLHRRHMIDNVNADREEILWQDAEKRRRWFGVWEKLQISGLDLTRSCDENNYPHIMEDGVYFKFVKGRYIANTQPFIEHVTAAYAERGGTEEEYQAWIRQFCRYSFGEEVADELVDNFKKQVAVYKAKSMQPSFQGQGPNSQRSSNMQHSIQGLGPFSSQLEEDGAKILHEITKQQEYISALLSCLEPFDVGIAIWGVWVRTKHDRETRQKMRYGEIVQTINDELKSLLQNVESVKQRQYRLSNELYQMERQLRGALGENGRLLEQIQTLTKDLEYTKLLLTGSRNAESSFKQELSESKLAHRKMEEELKGQLQTARNTAQAEIKQLENRNAALTDVLRHQQEQWDRISDELKDTQVALQQEKTTAQAEIEKVLNQTAFARKDVLKDELKAPFFGFIEKFREATLGQNTVSEFPVNSGHVDTLYYSYRPVYVNQVLRRLFADHYNIIEKAQDQEAVRKKKVLPVDILYGLAGVAGYFNLFKYLGQSQSATDRIFLQALLNLSFPPSYVGTLATSLTAASWLASEEHLPPIGMKPVNSSCFTLMPGSSKTGAEKAIAHTIIESEIQRLLDFRTSLFVAVSEYAPLSQEEEEELQGLPLRTAGPQARIEVRPEGDLGYTYSIEIIDLIRFPQPFPIVFTLDKDGKIVELDEERA
jgi:hypothetical protein